MGTCVTASPNGRRALFRPAVAHGRRAARRKFEGVVFPVPSPVRLRPAYAGMDRRQVGSPFGDKLIHAPPPVGCAQRFKIRASSALLTGLPTKSHMPAATHRS